MNVRPSPDELLATVERLAPFHHDIELPYGVRTHLPSRSRRPIERTRLANLVAHAFPSILAECGGSFRGLRVLDVACNCGGFAVEAARHGAEYVLGIDVVERYLEQAAFVKTALGLEQLDFRKMAVEDVDVAVTGRFDVTFCFGILYHLENPVLGMRKLATVTDRLLVIDTDVMRTPFVHVPLWRMKFPPPATEDSTNATTALWRPDYRCEFVPNRDAVIESCRFLGFSRVTALPAKGRHLERRYRSQRRITFIAAR